jgi:hypothetical protein
MKKFGLFDCRLRRRPAPAKPGDFGLWDLQAVLDGRGNEIIEFVEGGNAFRTLLS